MIDFYTWQTPNCAKVMIMLEETGLPYQVRPVDIRNNEQYASDFLKINPNNKIPAIVDQEGPDHQPLSLFESGAILIYLAEKSGKFLPKDPIQRIKAIQWLMFQMSGIGPMMGEVIHFVKFAKEKIPYAIDRYWDESNRLLAVMNDHLKGNSYFVNEYSIADMAFLPWVVSFEEHTNGLSKYPNLKRWSDSIKKRPAVQKSVKLLHTLFTPST